MFVQKEGRSWRSQQQQDLRTPSQRTCRLATRVVGRGNLVSMANGKRKV